MEEKKKTRSEARREYWNGIDPSLRSERMRSMAVRRWAGVSVEDRAKHALMMNTARYQRAEIDI